MPPPSPLPPLPQSPSGSTPRKKTLIIVACHAIYIGHPPHPSPSTSTTSKPTPTATTDEAAWHLSPFQHGETPTFLAHAVAGVEELKSSQREGVLIFSGGATKPSLTAQSESQSYLNLIRDHGLLSPSPDNDNAGSILEEDILLETHATDSLQNLLFSLLLFCQRYGYPPQQIVVVTHAFKERRFVELHCWTLRWPRENVRVVGIDPSILDEGDGHGRREAEDGEAVAREQWRIDWWGWGDVLGRKRERRGWKGGEGMHDVVRWRGGETGRERYPGILPWEVASDH